MNQDVLNPPSVEGWHTGKEWIDSGSMVERINFVADELGNPDRPGIRAIVDHLLSQDTARSAADVVDGCLDLLGCFVLRDDNRDALIVQAADALDGGDGLEPVILNTLRMIGSTREYQFA